MRTHHASLTGLYSQPEGGEAGIIPTVSRVRTPGERGANRERKSKGGKSYDTSFYNYTQHKIQRRLVS